LVKNLVSVPEMVFTLTDVPWTNKYAWIIIYGMVKITF
jgi:hypothetical protein